MNKVLSKIGFGLLEVLGAMGDAAGSMSKVRYKKMYRKSDASYFRGMKELKNKKLIKKIQKRQKSVYVLTEAGRQMLRRPKAAIKRNDGFSTLIIFDIPEERSRQRTIFRRYLVKNGYMALRESVYISPCVLSDEIKELVKELKLSLDVNVFSVKV